jgi:hypothetical protein
VYFDIVEQWIDEEAFMCLQEELIKELVKPIGARARFLTKWKQLKVMIH